jgi:hypothetical protein
MDLLRSIFANRLAHDIEKPFLTFVVPGTEMKFAVLAGRVDFWIQLSATLFIQAIVSVFFAIFIFSTIVKHRGSTSAFLIGYGLVIPTVIILPYKLIEELVVRNMCVMIGFASIPTVICFRCIEGKEGIVEAF